MGKAWNAEELASRTFFITTVGIAAFVAVVFIFIL
jgi:hypothetical protein